MNVQRKDEYQVVSFPQTVIPALVAVDSEIERLTFWLLSQEELHISSTTKEKISVKTPKLQILTFTHFLQYGIQGRVRGLNSLLSEQDYLTRIDGLRTLAALYSVFKRKEATTFEKVTSEMMSAAFARLDRDHPAANPVWIESYKAKQAAAFEGKAARTAKKRGFCQAVFGVAAF